MKRQLSSISLLAAALLAAPSAFSESAIVKCIDAGGRVTLTDRPCEAGSATIRMANLSSNDGVTRVEPHPLAADHDALPPPRLFQQAAQRRSLPLRRVAAKPMASDVATLKAARAQFLLSDVGTRPALARLE
jgi:hypothetical protein